MNQRQQVAAATTAKVCIAAATNQTTLAQLKHGFAGPPESIHGAN